MFTQFQRMPLAHIIPGPEGINISVETHGIASSPLTVVMIHGGYQSRRCFKEQYSTLAFGHFVISIDLPGNGMSSLPINEAKLSPKLYAETVHAVLTAFHLEQKPIVLVGWSFGGAVCRYYLDLFERQMRIVGLIQLASLLGGFGPYLSLLGSDPLFQPILAAFGGTDESPVTQHEKFIEHFFKRLLFSTSTLDEDTFDAIYGYNERAWWNLLPLGNTFLAELPQDDTMQRLARLTIPTLLLHGKEDALVPLSFSRQMNDVLPHSDLIEIEQCGHSLMLEQPSIVNRQMLTFLAGLPTA